MWYRKGTQFILTWLHGIFATIPKVPTAQQGDKLSQSTQDSPRFHAKISCRRQLLTQQPHDPFSLLNGSLIQQNSELLFGFVLPVSFGGASRCQHRTFHEQATSPGSSVCVRRGLQLRCWAHLSSAPPESGPESKKQAE